MEPIEERLTTRLRYEEGLAACSRSLIAGGRAVVDQALFHLLEAARASRVYVFESFEDPRAGHCWRQVHEVCAAGVKPQMANPVLQCLHASRLPELSGALDHGEAFWGITAEHPEHARQILEPQDVLSFLHIPLPIGEERYGFIGFDDTETARKWSEDDIRLLRVGAEMIGVYLGSQRSLREVADRQAQMDSILRAAPVGIAVVHGRTFIEVNDPLCLMSGYGREELLGMSTRILYATQEDFDRAGTRLRGLSGPDGSVSLEGRLYRKDGSVLEVLLNGSAIMPRNALKAATFAIVDLTEVKRAEKERRRLEAQVEEGRRHESIGVLAGGIAHDFNNLLMAIQGNVDLAMVDVPADPNLRESLSEIHKSAQKAAELTRQLLDYSGRSRMSREAGDLSAVVREATEDFLRLAGAKARLSFQLAEGLPPAPLDPGQIRQMIRSLIVNAAEAAIGDHVDITVRTDSVFLDETALSAFTMGNTARPGRFLRLEVADNGCGMDEAKVARIFEPFFTTRNQGRGLGLAAVLGIARAHGGCIGVKSAPGGGTTIRVHLPTVDA